MAVRRDKRKGYIVDFVYNHANGRKERIRRKSPVQTKRGAKAYEKELVKIAGQPKVSKATFAEFSKEFVDSYVAINNKKTEQITKKQRLKNHLLPFFGRMQLADIGVREIERFKAAQLGKELSYKSVNNSLAVLSRALNCAVEWGYLPHAPRVKWLKGPKPEMRFLEDDDAECLIEAAEPGLERTMILVALRTGLRIGELLALRWDDVDLVRRQLHVRQSCVRGHFDTPKSGRSRTVPLTDEVTRAIKGYRHLCGPLVFCNQDGSHLTDNQTKHYLYRACRKALMERCGWHTLRHTFASHLVMRGAPLKAVQELLGHASIDMTLRYAHLSPAAKNQAIDLLENENGRSYGTNMAPQMVQLQNKRKSYG